MKAMQENPFVRLVVGEMPLGKRAEHNFSNLCVLALGT